MTTVIAHRINTKKELLQVPPECGLEVDVRDRGNRLILSHDPFNEGEDFEAFLTAFHHRTLIVNIKSERIEYRVLGLLQQQGVDDFFLLDSSFPMIYQLTGRGIRKLALRFSEFEGLDTIMAMKGKVDWIWVDCFTRLPLDGPTARLLKLAGYKLCLVSPELVGRPEELLPYREILGRERIELDAVCTKLPHRHHWTPSC